MKRIASVFVRVAFLVLIAGLLPACGDSSDGDGGDAAIPGFGEGNGGGNPQSPGVPPGPGPGSGEPQPPGGPLPPPPPPPPPPGDPAFTLVQQQASDAVRCVAPAVDGSGDVYVGGAFFAFHGQAAGGIVRLNANGTIDAAFAPPAGFWTSQFDAGVWTICPATDGSGDVYVGGTFTQANGAAAGRIVRLNADGTTDAGFATGAGFSGGPTAAAREIIPAIDGSGDIYVRLRIVGFYQGQAVSGVVRLNANGTRDTAFSTGSGFGNGSVYAFATVPDESGDLLIAGSFTTYNGTAVGGLARLNPNGSVDTSLTAPPGLPSIGSTEAWSLAPALDGSGDVYLSVGRYPTTDEGVTNLLRRLNADGSVDAGFQAGTSTGQGDGWLGGQAGSLWSVVVDPASGDVWIGGEFSTYGGVVGRNRILRLNGNGTVDAQFNSGFGFSSFVYGLALAPGGGVYAAGRFGTYNWAFGTSGVCRLNGDGTPDTTFACGSGLDLWNYSDAGVYAVAAAVNGTGDVYVGGTFAAYNGVPTACLVRLNPDGTRDAGFSVGSGFGNLVSPPRIRQVIPMADGDVYVSGMFNSYNGLAAADGVMRLNANGTLDAGFNFQYDTWTINGIALVGDNTGDIYVASDWTVVRCSPAGNVLQAFPFQTYAGPGTLAAMAERVNVVTPALDGSGDVYVGGTFTTCNGVAAGRLVRLNADGSVDNAFTGNLDNPGGALCVVRAIVRADDGSGDIYVGGLFRTCNGVPVSEVVRLNADGTLDAGFNAGAPPAGASLDAVNVIRLAGDGSGDIYIAGAFEQFGGQPANRVARLNADGSLDAGFAGNVTSPGIVFALGVQPGGGELYIGGTFRTYGARSTIALAGLNPDGTID